MMYVPVNDNMFYLSVSKETSSDG